MAGLKGGGISSSAPRGRLPSKNGAGVPELLAQGRSGDLAYTVHLEYIAVRSGPSATSVEKTYRVTHIFRREDDAWKLIHRHADPLIDTHPPT